MACRIRRETWPESGHGKPCVDKKPAPHSTNASMPPTENRLRFLGRETFEGALDLSLNRATLNGSHASHDHDFWEIALIAGGGGVHVGRGGATRAERGQAFFLRPRVWHAYRDCVALDVRNVCWSEAFLARELSALRHGPLMAAHLESWRHPAWCGERELRFAPDEFETTLTRWEEAFAARSNIERTARTLLLFEALWNGVPIEANQTRALHPAARTCAALLEHELGRAWTLAELGRRAHLSPEHLSREFKRAFGLAPMEYLARHRLERAAARLVSGDEPLAHIGQSVGYDDASYFARRFQKQFGMSPREYRKQFNVSQDPKEAEKS